MLTKIGSLTLYFQLLNASSQRLNANAPPPQLHARGLERWPITLLDTEQGRHDVAADFANRCEQILGEAMRWAPQTTQSHLQVR